MEESEQSLGAVIPFTVLPCGAPPVRLYLDVSPEVTCDHAREHVLECAEEVVGAGRRWGLLKERWRGCGKEDTLLTDLVLVRLLAPERPLRPRELLMQSWSDWGRCCEGVDYVIRERSRARQGSKT